MTSDLVGRTVSFCRALRGEGLRLGVDHEIDAVRALRAAGIETRERVRLALRCVLTSSPAEQERFDVLFDDFFARPRTAEETAAHARVERRSPPKTGASAASLDAWDSGGGTDEGEAEEVPGASDAKALADKDFAHFDSDELDEIQRLAARLARKLAARPSRRWRTARKGPRIDLRATVRKSLSNAAEPLDLRFRVRRPRKTRIVALCDVSGSMDLYSQFLLQFLYALQGSVARVESFVFSTELRRITGLLRTKDYALALSGLSAEVHDWSGGTRIGASLAAFNADWGRLVDRRTVVVILSDGWDTGDPELLSGEMELLRRRSKKLIWLNPLLGSPGYEPITQGMQAALPHVSVFAPAHNLAALRALERHLLG